MSSTVMLPLQHEKDLISQLPHDILFNVLYPLCMKDAAQTSILSKEWRHLWTHRTHLDFDPSIIIPDFSKWLESEFISPGVRRSSHVRRYVKWVNQVLSVHSGPCVNKFRVSFPPLPVDNSDINGWVNFAVSRRVEELVLDFDWGYRIVLCSIGFDLFKNPSCEIGIKFLKSLHLCYVGVSGEFLEFILSRCCLLERLYVVGSDDIVHLKVTSSKLKDFGMVLCSSLQELEIDAPNLIKFQYENVWIRTQLVFKNVASVVQAKLRGNICEEPESLLRQISCFTTQLSKLSLSLHDLSYTWYTEFCVGGRVPFPNVKFLELKFDCQPDDRLTGFTELLEAFPSLCELKLKMVIYTDEVAEEAAKLQEVDASAGSEGQFENEKQAHELLEMHQHTDAESEDWLEQIENPGLAAVNSESRESMQDHKMKVAHPKLKALGLKGFMGCQVDVNLALRIVDYAVNLERIVCDPWDILHLYWDTEEIEASRSRARKLAKLVGPNVKLIIL